MDEIKVPIYLMRKDPVSDIYVGAGLFSDPGEDASDPL